MEYKSVVLGGTFDGLHAGHQALIAKAFAVGQQVTIGLTTDEYVQKFKVGQRIGPFAERKAQLTAWLAGQGWGARATILPLHDTYGLTLKTSYDAIVVSSETAPVADEINQKRVAAGFAPLAIVTIPLVHAEDGQAISSTRLRHGEIDAAGNLVMPEGLRSALGQPLGTVLTGQSIGQSLAKHAQDRVIVVGDMATKTVLEAGIQPKLAIIDGRVGRLPYPDAVQLLGSMPIPIPSGPGYISNKAVEIIKGGKERVLLIEGEEDLLVLPALLASPESSIIYYGQPGEGLVEVLVTPQKKEVAQRLLDQFT